MDDEGLGVPPQLRADLFEMPVGQQERARSPRLGLWLCRRILRADGGEIWLDTSKRGASFSSVWPIVDPRPAPRLAQRPERWPSDRAGFAKAVRAVREQAGLTRQVLSLRAGIAESTLRNIETGRHGITASIRTRLVRALEDMTATVGPAGGSDDES